ncbi:hypothetical protein COOONC_15379 [Cooperia oncophora]
MITDSKCSGVLISPRHILTAAHCLLYKKRKSVLTKMECRRNGHRNTHRFKTGTYWVFVGSRCIDPQRCRIPWLRVARVHYHEDYDECSLEDDIAVLELAESVPSQWATPICLPDREETISRPPPKPQDPEGQVCVCFNMSNHSTVPL